MGEPKYKLTIGSTSLLERAVASLRTALDGDVTIVGKLEEGFFDTIPDVGDSCRLHSIPDIAIGAGPVEGTRVRSALIGVYSALAAARSEWIAVLACDLPFVTTELISELKGHISDDLDAVVPVQSDGRQQPLCAFYRTEPALLAAHQMIKAGKLAMSKFVSMLNTRRIEFEEIAGLEGSVNFFLNVNTPDDYSDAKELG